MLQFEELRLELNDNKQKLSELREALGLDALKEEIAKLEEQTAAEEFWGDIENSQKVLQRISQLKNKVAAYTSLETAFDDTMTLIELADEEEDLSMFDECREGVTKFEDELEKQTLSTLLNGEYDAKNALLTFHAGAGGTEAQDWTSMLFRMYTRYCEKMGFTVKVLDLLDGDEAGIKSVTFEVSGDHAYGYLRGEKGVHRLVRISPFDANARRHTSFASLDVAPMLEDDDSDIEINMKDVRVDTYHSSGAGGQNVNKTSSAVRMTHYPTGIVVSCQTQRDQFQNRETCMRMLRSKLIEIKEREHLDKISDIKGAQLKIEWGSQIRNYVFMPYTLVKDTRTGYETSNVNAVMDGGLDGFINAYLTCLATNTWVTKS